MKVMILQALVIFIIILLICYLISILKTNNKETRISDFSLSKSDFDKSTLFQKINHFLWNFIHKISNKLTRNTLLNKRAMKYEKYILIKEEDYKSPIDYMTVKIVVLLLTIFLYFILLILNAYEFNIITLIVFIVLSIVIPDFIWQLSYIQKIKRIQNKIYESIIIIDNNISKTNIYNAISKVINEVDEDLQDEYLRIQTDLSYNISLFQAFNRFYDRTNIKEIKTIANILNVEQTNLVSAFKTIREELSYRDKLRSSLTTTNIILSIIKIILMLVPIILIVLINIINPTYFIDIINNSIGVILLEVVVVIYVVLLFVIKRIVGDNS